VNEGETRTVTIETTGDQGDGIAKVERGYVVIVPGTVPGDELEVEMEMVKQNFALAEVVDGDELTYE
jgi:predicted RNA-binding protein with TRAM domain